MYEKVKQVIAKSDVKRFHIILMLLCMFIVLTEGYDLVIYGAIKGQIIESWGMDKVTAGLLGSAALAGMMFGSITLGILADLYGRKRVLIICLALFSVFTGIAGFMNAPLPFAICRFFAGIGIGGAMPNAVGLLSDYAPQKSRNTLIATAMAGMQIGGILSPLITIATGSSGWRICMWIGFLPLLLVPYMIKALPDSIDYNFKKGKTEKLMMVMKKIDPNFTETEDADWSIPSSTKSEKSPVTELFVNRRALNTALFWMAFFSGLLMIYGLNTWLPELMQSAGYDVGSSLNFLLALNIAAFFGSIVLGRIADKVNTQKLLVTLYLCGIVSMMLLSIQSNIVIAYTLISISGVCVFGPQNIGTSFVAEYYPSRIRSTALGVCNTVGRVGGILGPTLGGVLMAASLPLFYNCLAIASPGVVAAMAYGLVRTERGKAASLNSGTVKLAD
jgi:MFS transporter, AAHS family, benzoate transport protein